MIDREEGGFYTCAPMETKIRLTRVGAKKKPFYRLVVAGSESSRDGRFLEVVGHYDPLKGFAKAQIDKDKILAWIKKGAQASPVVKQILKAHP